MSSLIKNLQRTTPQRPTDAFDVPKTFAAFCVWIGVTLSAGQSELVRVAFDGHEPMDHDLTVEIFGTHLSMGFHRVVAAVCGARSGKSYVLVALRLVWGMLVRDLSSMAPGQRAVAMIVAPNEKLRREVLNYALGAIKSKPELATMLSREMTDMFELTRPDGKKVYFEGGVATAGGYGAVGRAYTDFAMDECAFFRDSSFKVNDQDIFRAGATRVLPGGQVIVASTPWAQAGLLYELHRDNFGKPNNALVAHAKTLTMNPSPTVRAIVEVETQRDPDNAAREYDARFMTAGTTLFFEQVCIDSALTDELYETQPGDIIVAGGDFGFRSDSSALVLVALRNNVLHVFDGEELRPGDQPLKPSKTVAAFAARINGRCEYLMADQHYREAIAEHLEDHSLSYAAAPLTPADTYVRARMLLREGRVKVHPLPFRDRLVQQMREVHGRPTSGGGMSIVHPRWATGGHGDLVAALVLAIWQVSGNAIPEPGPEMGTVEWEALRREKRQRRMTEMSSGEADRGRRAFWRKR
jgi:hypothetical protein